KNSGVLRLITIASYLEKEVPGNDDRRIVAGIIEKRLKIGMPIQIDATVLYNKCSGRFSECPLLVKSDFKKDSPYNTYTRLGLTPTPISNPSLDAIKAVIEKKDSGYWFYLSDPKTKKTIFSENLEKHNINRAKYLLNNK
ncbi:endolytic transglycosylase MltG, partial [Candidatus Wolfebacteria bacterium CG02_land_8_20_14_3_00_37_12]